jgi:hypothetical protein
VGHDVVAYNTEQRKFKTYRSADKIPLASKMDEIVSSSFTRIATTIANMSGELGNPSSRDLLPHHIKSTRKKPVTGKRRALGPHSSTKAIGQEQTGGLVDDGHGTLCWNSGVIAYN